MTATDRVEIPVQMEYEKQGKGSLRRVSILNDTVDEPFTETSEWKLESVTAVSDIQEEYDLNSLSSTQRIGVILVDPESLEWEFQPDGVTEKDS